VSPYLTFYTRIVTNIGTVNYIKIPARLLDNSDLLSSARAGRV